MIDGTAGAMEPLLWYYAKDKPFERIETSAASALARITNADFKARLMKAIKAV